jgi:type VI secretion system protein ImpF
MPAIPRDQPLLPSVLDRLIDTAPDVRREPSRGRNQTLRELKQAVRRDLENLLNTRVRCVPWPSELKEIKRSLVNYGIPDLTGSSFGSAKEREEFCRTIRGIIAQYETRLKNLSVRLVDSSESIDRTIRFHIDAVLHAEPAPEPIQFDSTLRLTTATFEVKGESGG